MSEDVLLHFREAHWQEVAQRLTSLAPRHPERETMPHRPPDGWLYPEGLNFVTLEQYEDYLTEYEPERIGALHRLLGGTPACSLDVNFRRQRQYDVCAVVESLCLRLLRLFPGVVDDNHGDFWTVEEIVAGVVKADGKFLALYRL